MTTPLKDKLHRENIYKFITLAIPHMITEQLFTLLGYRRNYLDYSVFKEVFIEQQYLWLYKKLLPGTTLIDIGAYVGDTAVYFAASENVDRIYAYELMTSTYLEAKRNIAISPYTHKILLFNNAISDKPEEFSVSDKRQGTPWTSSLETKTGKGVSAIPLNDVLSGKKNIAIKADCEGAESHIFENADLSNVYALEIEYHNDVPNCDVIVERTLRSKGFIVRKEVKKAYHKQGFIYAERQT